MDQALLRAYQATLYELPSSAGPVRASLDGDPATDPRSLPEVLQRTFALLTAYNPRSMLLPRRVNDGRHLVLRDLLILGCYRIEPAVGSESEAESTFREPAWLVNAMDRDEAIAFGRVFRQNAIVYSTKGKPELVITDPTADDVGRSFPGTWRMRT